MTRSRQSYRVHFLKTLPLYFSEVVEGRKDWETRKDDRNYRNRDLVVLREFDPKKGYTGREIVRLIAGYPLKLDDAGLPGFVSFPIRRPE